MSGVNVQYAVEADPHAALTFRRNHPGVNLLEDDITNVIAARDMPLLGQQTKIVFGGPPCQGFSTSNQKNRSSANPNNWLFEEYLRLVEEITPEWIVFENVKGLIETENGYFLEQVLKGIESKGFTTSHFILNSAGFGVPQRRNRLFIVGSRRGKKINAPSPTVKKYVSVREALHDLPDLQNGDSRDLEYYRWRLQELSATRSLN
ncbi:DNA cytosine methyltransferase [Pseudomonas sp. PONIH3]|uniref:DNA cytosine methyltransferase n=1 Tax=Pseudomonas sp. PONIH3 TaxID=1636610 RepID=UPI002114CBD9|nr:DNA (cytosine-5-)-methyltransferase [Pseudomonas sp. PONIH3]